MDDPNTPQVEPPRQSLGEMLTAFFAHLLHQPAGQIDEATKAHIADIDGHLTTIDTHLGTLDATGAQDAATIKALSDDVASAKVALASFDSVPPVAIVDPATPPA